MSPYCVPCKAEMECIKNGVRVIERFEDGTPYQVWSGDLYRCPTCGNQVVPQYGFKPVAQHWQDTFHKQLMDWRELDLLIE